MEKINYIIQNDNLRKALLFIYIFYLVYSPVIASNKLLNPFLTLPILLVIIACSYIYKKDYSIFLELKKQKYLILISGLIISSIYFFVRAMIKIESVPSLQESRLLQNNIPIIYLLHFIVVKDNFKKLNMKTDQILYFILNVVLLQSFIAILMALNSQFKEVAVYLHTLFNENNQFILKSRLFGFSNDYTFATPIFHGLIAGLALVFGVINDKKALFYMPFIFVLIILNGRTGLLLFAIPFVLLLIYLLFQKDRLKQLLIAVIATGLSLAVSFSFVSLTSRSTYNHAIQGVTETVKTIETKEAEGTYDHLLTEMFFIPKTAKGIIFGEGHRVYGKWADKFDMEKSSDMGYVNDMFMGGLVYVSILYGSYLYYVYLVYNENNSRIYLVIILSLVGVLAAANIKGEILKSPIIPPAIFIVTVLLDKLQNNKSANRLLP